MQGSRRAVSPVRPVDEPRRQIDAVWRDAEKKHCVRVPPEFRRMVERRYFGDYHDWETQLGDFIDAVDDFIENEMPVILTYVRQQAASPRAIALGGGRAHPRGRSRIYQKPFERRLRIVDFVAQTEVPFPYLLQRRLDTGGRRIFWGPLSTEWNRTHPDDPLGREPLRVAYTRARNEPYLREVYFDRKFAAWARIGDELPRTTDVLLAAHSRDIEGMPVPEDIFVALHRGQAIVTESRPPEWFEPLNTTIRHKCRLIPCEAGWPRGEALCSEGRCGTCDVWSQLRDLTPPDGGVWLFQLRAGKGACLAAVIGHPSSSAPSPPPRELCVGHIPPPGRGDPTAKTVRAKRRKLNKRRGAPDHARR
jgi:hypothetical protein